MRTEDKAATIRAALTTRPDGYTTAALLLAMITSARTEEREQAKRHIRELAQVSQEKPARIAGSPGPR